jgi:hypothetical protein
MFQRLHELREGGLLVFEKRGKEACDKWARQQGSSLRAI